MRRAKLVESVRGAKGGYKLAKSDKDISLADILIAAEEQINMSCGNGATCSTTEPCLTHDLWVDLSDQIDSFLQGISLASLVDRQQHHHDPAQSSRIAATILN